MLFHSLALATTASLAAAGSGLRERDLQGQPAAKFAATLDKTAVVAADCLDVYAAGSIWGDFSITVNGNNLDVFCGNETEVSEDLVLSKAAPLGKIKFPNDKEILITLSAQINLFTLNTATSKKVFDDGYYGNIGATSSMAGVDVKLWAIPAIGGASVLCEPGEVTMSSRYVELRNRIGGNVTYTDCVEEDELDCEIKIADVGLESSIGIAMDTTAAHSFQWVCPDMPSDVYDIKAMFSLTSRVNDLCDDTSRGDCDTIADLAAARVILGKRIMTIQQVRVVKGSLEI